MFESVRKGNLDITAVKSVKAFKTFTTLHSSINRISGTTGDEGSLFELEEYALEKDQLNAETISIYLKIKDGWEEKVLTLFREMPFRTPQYENIRGRDQNRARPAAMIFH